LSTFQEGNNLLDLCRYFLFLRGGKSFKLTIICWIICGCSIHLDYLRRSASIWICACLSVIYDSFILYQIHKFIVSFSCIFHLHKRHTYWEWIDYFSRDKYSRGSIYHISIPPQTKKNWYILKKRSCFTFFKFNFSLENWLEMSYNIWKF
jgi:hypothetical protein